MKPGARQHGHQPQNLLLLSPCLRMLSQELRGALEGALSGQGSDKSCCKEVPKQQCLISRFLNNCGQKAQFLSHHPMTTLAQALETSRQLEMPECRGGLQKDPWGVQAHQNVGLGSHGHGLLAPRRRADAVFSHLAGQAMKWALKGMVASR